VADHIKKAAHLCSSLQFEPTLLKFKPGDQTAICWSLLVRCRRSDENENQAEESAAAPVVIHYVPPENRVSSSVRNGSQFKSILFSFLDLSLTGPFVSFISNA
jgi:hypothetical protein